VVASEDSIVRLEDTPDNRERADLVILDRDVRHDPSSDKSKAALARLSQSSQAWTDGVMEQENDTAAAFPVRVGLEMPTRQLATIDQPAADEPTGAPGDVANGSPDDGTNNGSQGETNATNHELTAESANLLPSQITPPFPMKSLLLTFAYLIPLTFVGDLVAGSVFSERVRSRGTPLLASPVSPGGLVLGKALPYLAVTAAVAGLTTLVLAAGWVAFAASLPIVGFAMAAAVAIGILAPSQRSLTFLLVSVNVMLSTFLFLPAIFTHVEPVAYLSPVGLISAGIRGEALTAGHLAYGTVPLWGITLTIAAVSVAMFREETLMSARGGLSKLVDGVARLIPSRPRLFWAGVLAVPLAMVLELFVLVFAVTLDIRLAFVAFLIGGALVEEALKAVPAYAAYAREGPANTWAPGVVGPLIGIGFFVGEKSAFGLSWLGFGTLPGGSDALAVFGVGPSRLIVLAPIALHAATVTATAFTAREGKLETVTGWLGASILHAAYNGIAILLASGGGLF
jgi:hypothetical protein